MTQTEALKLVQLKLHAIQQCHPHAVLTLALEAEEIIKEALSSPNGESHPEQEPVALYANIPTFYVRDVNGAYIEDNPLNYYTTPPQRKPLNDDEAFELIEQDYQMEEYAQAALRLIRRTEAAHGIKE